MQVEILRTYFCKKCEYKTRYSCSKNGEDVEVKEFCLRCSTIGGKNLGWTADWVGSNVMLECGYENCSHKKNSTPYGRSPDGTIGYFFLNGGKHMHYCFDCFHFLMRKQIVQIAAASPAEREQLASTNLATMFKKRNN